MNELLTLNLKGSVDEATSNFNLNSTNLKGKTPTKGESFSTHLKTQIAKKDEKDEPEKATVNKSNKQTKIKQRRERPVSAKKSIESDDKNTVQAQSAGIQKEKPQDNVKHELGNDCNDNCKNESFDNSSNDSLNFTSDDVDSNETLAVFLETYLNMTDMNFTGSSQISEEDIKPSELVAPVEAEGISDPELMDELSALDMDMSEDMDMSKNLDMSENMDMSKNTDEPKLDDSLAKMNELLSAKKSDQAKPNIDETKKEEITDNSLLTEAIKSKPIEQNPELKVTEQDNRSKAVSSITEAGDYSSNNVSTKVEAGRDLPKAVASAAPPRMFTVNEHKFVITKLGDNKVEVTLEPNGIGKLRIEVNHEKGVIHASISASEQSGKDIIEKNINRIMEELAKEGINIGEFSVSLKERHDQSDDSNKSAHRDINNIKESVKEDIAAPIRQRHSNGRLSIFI